MDSRQNSPRFIQVEYNIFSLISKALNDEYELRIAFSDHMWICQWKLADATIKERIEPLKSVI